jgi:anti-anti-sigma factor
MSPGETAPPAPSPSGASKPKLPVFRLTGRDLDGDFREVAVEGELDLAVADRLKAEIGAGGGRAVLVDLSRCTFIDSTGLAVVLLARRDGERIAIHSPSAPVRRILAVAGLTGDGVVFESRDEAMSGLAAQGGRG